MHFLNTVLHVRCRSAERLAQVGFLSLTGAAGERRRPICGAGPAEKNRPAPEAGPFQQQTCARGRAFFVTMWAWIHPKLGILPTVRALHIPCMYCKTVFYGSIRVHTFRKLADRAISTGGMYKKSAFQRDSAVHMGYVQPPSMVCAAPSYRQVSLQPAFDIDPAMAVYARQALCPSDRYGPTALSLPLIFIPTGKKLSRRNKYQRAPPVHEATGGYAVRRA